MTFRPLAARRQRGITLVEMMVAMVVGLILMVGIVQLFVSNKQAYRIQEGANVLNENARYLMNQMQYDLRMADHWGGVEAGEIDVDGDIDSIADDCDGAAAALRVAGVYGIDGDDASPLDCIPDSDYVPNSDIVIVRYAEPIRRASGALDDDRVYVRTAVGRRGYVFQGANLADLPSDLTPEVDDAATVEDEVAEQGDVANFRYRTFVYFLRPCSSQDLGAAGVCDDADDRIPTLTRLSLDGLALVEQDVIAGVEQMQLAYGVDDNGDRSPDRYLSAEDITADDDWGKVIDVKLSVLIRNTELDTTANDDSEYTLYGGADGDGIVYTVPEDAKRYRRKVFNTSIQIRNMTRG
ncbi:MAG: PilW family protein [Gammaproteobacteria bacterium]